MQIQEIMTPDPACCAPQTSLKDVARMMVDNDCGAIPVVESDESRKPVGIVSDRDITCRAVAQGRNPLEMTVSEVMSHPVRTINMNESLDEACKLMEREQVRRVIVVDENGDCCGIVAQADIARKLGESESGELLRDISQPGNGARQARQYQGYSP